MRVRKLANDGLKIIDDIPHYAKQIWLSKPSFIMRN
jgi:hypothetical protein